MDICSYMVKEKGVKKKEKKKDDHGLGEANSAHFTPVADSKTVSNLP